MIQIGFEAFPISGNFLHPYNKEVWLLQLELPNGVCGIDTYLLDGNS